MFNIAIAVQNNTSQDPVILATLSVPFVRRMAVDPDVNELGGHKPGDPFLELAGACCHVIAFVTLLYTLPRFTMML